MLKLHEISLTENYDDQIASLKQTKTKKHITELQCCMRKNKCF